MGAMKLGTGIVKKISIGLPLHLKHNISLLLKTHKLEPTYMNAWNIVDY
jgi:hypothetical protein